MFVKNMDDSRLFPFWGKPVEVDSEFLEVALSETEDLALVEKHGSPCFLFFPSSTIIISIG